MCFGCEWLDHADMSIESLADVPLQKLMEALS